MIAIETPTVEEALAHVERDLQALGPQSAALNTVDAQADYVRRHSILTNRRAALVSHSATIGRLAPKIEADEKWHADLTAWRATLQAELDLMPPRIRTEQQLGALRNVKTSIRIIDHGLLCDGEWKPAKEPLRLGELMRASGYQQAPPEPNTNQAFGPLPWFGSIAEVERRLRENRAQRDDAQRRLEHACRESVMTDAEFEAARAAELARIAAANARPQVKTRMDGSTYQSWRDGRIEELEGPDAARAAQAFPGVS